ncbi:MAG TPA: hypothetical protein VNU95_07155 [Candidatus Acidoferrales bacterium]|jgi:hypothetical protein|nr:hypothetical protein [Candidatus Acidoferrales bacterium]
MKYCLDYAGSGIGFLMCRRSASITRSTRLAEAPSYGKSIILYDKYRSDSAAQVVAARLNGA